MTISRVSFLGSSQAQIARLRDMNTTLADLSRQVASRRKYQTLAGFGADAATIQRNRTEKGRVESYLGNLGAVTTTINVMNTAMTSARSAVDQVIQGLTTSVHQSSADIPALAALAKNALSFIQDLANTQLDGRHLFAGDDTTSPPFQDASALNGNFQTQISDWLAGTITTAQFVTNTDSLTTAQLGMNPGLSAAGPVAVRVDDGTELDYTVKADEDGFKELIRALGLMANMKAPGPADVPASGDVNTVLNKILSIARTGVQQLDSAATRVGTNFNLIKSVQESHEQDVALLDGLIGDAEDADTTEVVAQLQSLQTQLQASYEVTRIASQLSLVNFL